MLLVPVPSRAGGLINHDSVLFLLFFPSFSYLRAWHFIFCMQEGVGWGEAPGVSVQMDAVIVLDNVL